MSWLYFNRKSRKLHLFAGTSAIDSIPIGSWDAHNDTTSNSLGQWPDETWRYSHYKSHQDDQPGFGPACFSTSYGCSGIHVFNVPERTGMGVHAGRQTWDKYKKDILGGKTLGCIRTTDAAMSVINTVHRTDKLEFIVVGNDHE